jgi:hypothetical protein
MAGFYGAHRHQRARFLKVIVPAGLIPGEEYTLQIITMSIPHGSGHLLKDKRNIRSDFKLIARVAPATTEDAGTDTVILNGE